MKNNRGKSLISIIVTILILTLIIFLLYEVLYVDIFNIMSADTSVLNLNEVSDEVQISDVENQSSNSENVEEVNLIISGGNSRQ